MKRLIKALTLLLLITFSFAAKAQVDTIRLKDKRLNTSYLKPGINQYLVFYQLFKNPKKMVFTYWIRDIRKTRRNGQNVFTINQHWWGDDSTSYYKIFSVNRVSDFAPLFHSETDLDTTSTYNWYEDKITGADTAHNNPKKGFTFNFTTPNFNWNLDIETFELLPLAAGKIFAINFYDAGLEFPRYVIYKVIGDETLATLDNHNVDCWKLRTEGQLNGHPYTETYWIAKKSHEFLKEEDAYANGYRYKIKMPAGMPDIVSRYTHLP